MRIVKAVEYVKCKKSIGISVSFKRKRCFFEVFSKSVFSSSSKQKKKAYPECTVQEFSSVKVKEFFGVLVTRGGKSVPR